MDASSPDLSRFFARGGKLLHVHGWSDATIPPGSSIRYGAQVRRQARDASAARRSYRLFMVPGMGHSRGGTGMNSFDSTRIIEAWVEAGRVPQEINAARVIDGKVVRTRPLCAWPRAARWDGRGSTDSAGSFVCTSPPGK
jgi:feruloyl esterase